MARLVLVRHGRSAHVHTAGWIDGAGLRAWAGAYDAAGIRDDDRPPAPLAALGGLRLPLRAWAVAIGGHRFLSARRGQFPSPADTARADQAAAWLDGLARRHASIVVVTHAAFRPHLAERLVLAGWTAEPGPRNRRHWSAWQFTRS